MEPVDYTATIPLVRRNADGSVNRRDLTFTFPAVDVDTAETVARRAAWEVVAAMPSVGDNNAHGWKIASHGVAVEPAS